MFLSQSATDINGAHVPMSRYAGRLVVVVNVASEDHARNYTMQNYERLNYIYSKYNGRGLEASITPAPSSCCTTPGHGVWT